MATAINQMNRFLPSFITLVVGVDSETEGSAIGATLPSEGENYTPAMADLGGV